MKSLFYCGDSMNVASYSGFGTFCGSLWVNISFSVPCARLSPD